MSASDTDALHVVFTPSGAGILRQALRLHGLRGRVTQLTDNFSYGPIRDTDSPERFQWLRSEIGTDEDWPEEYDDLSGDIARFWADSSVQGKRVVWLTRRSGQEFTGFLEWVRRHPNESYDVVDLSDVPWPGEPCAQEWLVSLAYVAPELINAKQLLAGASPLNREQLQHYANLWDQLRIENADLRVVGPAGLISAPITYYDNTILSLARGPWIKIARLGAEAAVETWKDDYAQILFEFFFGRIRKLANAGQLEFRGNLGQERECEVRAR